MKRLLKMGLIMMSMGVLLNGCGGFGALNDIPAFSEKEGSSQKSEDEESQIQRETDNDSDSSYSNDDLYQPGRVKVQCPKCYGVKTIPCTACDGKGYRIGYDNSVPNYSGSSGSRVIETKEYCYRCRGTGSITCTRCGGTGQL